MSIDVIIDRIRRRMETLRTNASATSKRSGLSSDAIREIFQTCSVTYKTLEKIAGALDCSVAHLISDAADDPNEQSFALMPRFLQNKQPVEFDSAAFDKPSKVTEYWIEQRGGSVSTYEYSKLLWRFYEHETIRHPAARGQRTVVR